MTANGSSTYYRGGVMVYDGDELAYMFHPDGVVRKTNSSYIYQYNLPDHVGSTRVVLAATGANSLTEVQRTNYYPFGTPYGLYDNLGANKYLFGGKELQDASVGGESLALYDFHARFYDPFIARWMRQDPLARKFSAASPYNYCANNPIRFIDPNGMSFESAADSAFADVYDKFMGGVRDEYDARAAAMREERREAYLSNNSMYAQSYSPFIAELTTLSYTVSRSISELGYMKTSDSNTFAFSPIDNKAGLGYVERKPNGTYVINYDPKNMFASLAHETKHAYQIMTDTKNRWRSVSVEIEGVNRNVMGIKLGSSSNWNVANIEYRNRCETEAYRAQYAVDPTSLPDEPIWGNQQVPQINSIHQINGAYINALGYGEIFQQQQTKK